MALRLPSPTQRRSSLVTPSATVLVAVSVTLLLSIVLASFRADLVGGAPPSPAQPVTSPAASPTPTPTSRPTPPATTTSTPSPTVSPTPTPSPAPTPLPTPRATPAPTAPPPVADGPPACAYTDILTPRHGYGDWPISLLDTIYHLPADYAPGDLVDSGGAGVNAGYLVRSLIVADLREMAAAARARGTPIQLVSGYRSHAQQHATFNYWVGVGGYEQALRTSARAGHSEHQLGTTIDVTSEGGLDPWAYADWATTPAGAWMAANAWRYGFVMSYPRGAFQASCYDYEPWHYRYVGRDLAARIAGSGRVPRLVLWELQ
ncbi:MAG TPA: M15 family metallopeptidase [Candidatus Binatia bacterium]|nr:M15 family metallopeptidase [Candidatus Binatia bacterium]